MIFSFQRAIVGGEIQTTRYGPPLMESVPENIPLPKVKLLPYRNYIFYSVANFLTILAIILFPTVINRTGFIFFFYLKEKKVLISFLIYVV